VIHSFTGTNGDGYGPGAGVTVDGHGHVFGMTPTGGADGYGIVFELQPGANGVWTEKVIHTFAGGADGIGGSAAGWCWMPPATYSACRRPAARMAQESYLDLRPLSPASGPKRYFTLSKVNPARDFRMAH